MGRHSSITEEAIVKIGEAVKLGTGLYRAAQLAGVQEQTMRRWMRRGEKDLEAGEETLEAKLVQTIREKSATIVSLMEGSVVRAALHDRDIRASTWWLERRLPDEYGRKDKLEVQVKQQMIEDFLDMLRDRLDGSTYQRVLEAVAGERSDGTPPLKLLS